MNFADAACEPGLLEAVMPGKESLSWEEFCYDNSSYELNSKLQFCKFAKSCKPTSAPFKSELTSFTNTSRLTCNLWNARDDNGSRLVISDALGNLVLNTTTRWQLECKLAITKIRIWCQVYLCLGKAQSKKQPGYYTTLNDILVLKPSCGIQCP